MITLLKVCNYKSLENVELPLGPLHVFVGPNNSGKSNLFDAFQFLRELSETGLQAVHSRGGFSQIIWGGDIKRAISFELHMVTGVEKIQKNKLIYSLEIGGNPRYPTVTKEKLAVVKEKSERPLLIFPGENRSDVTVLDITGKHILSLGRSDHMFEQFLDEERYGLLAVFAREMRSWSLYNFETSVMRRPNAVRQDFHLQQSGANFSSVLHAIQSEHKEKFSEIESLLKTALPEVRQLLTALTKDGQTYLSWEEASTSMRVPGWAMSDGSLRLLGQLAALFSPEPPALACYEEPENYLHPAWLSLVADAIKSAAPETQVLSSTHSPYLLDFFSPENLVIVEKKNGRSQFMPVKNKKGLKDALRVLGLGEIWYSGQLGGTP
jgi:predicted ATPase